MSVLPFRRKRLVANAEFMKRSVLVGNVLQHLAVIVGIRIHGDRELLLPPLLLRLVAMSESVAIMTVAMPRNRRALALNALVSPMTNSGQQNPKLQKNLVWRACSVGNKLSELS